MIVRIFIKIMFLVLFVKMIFATFVVIMNNVNEHL